MKNTEARAAGLPEGVADYIEVAVGKLQYRPAVQDAVRGEFVRYFSWALKKCGSEQERGERGEQLIGGFDDSKVAAKLIRRGRRRCRPWWKKGISWGWQGAAVLVVVFVCYVVWFLAGEPVVRVDYVEMVNEMGRRDVPADENALTHYEKAIELLGPNPGINVAPARRGLFTESFVDIDEDEAGKIRAFVDEHGGCGMS